MDATVDEVKVVFQSLLQVRPEATEVELQFVAAATFEIKSLQTSMELLAKGRLEVYLRSDGNMARVNDYLWREWSSRRRTGRLEGGE